MVLSYKECLKNHAASLGGHALDGCGEFMPSTSATPTDPDSLKCAACGCHRNFHRRDSHDTPAFIRRIPPPPNTATPSSSPSTTPPSPVPHSYYTSAPDMMLALKSAYSSGPQDEYIHHLNGTHPSMPRIMNYNNKPSGRKRARTKFSKEQKEKMHAFAERLGWRMHKNEARSIEEFCYEVGVDRGVFKVWMHNNKNTFNKKDIIAVDNLNLGNNNIINRNNEEDNGDDIDSSTDVHTNKANVQLHVSTNNGSSAS